MRHPQCDTTSPLYCPPDRVPREGETIFSDFIHARSKPDYTIDHETGCWNWIKGLSPQGYPGRYAHRRYLERATGTKLPKGWHTHHKCHNKRCVNPDHLEAQEPRPHIVSHRIKYAGDGNLTFEYVQRVRELYADPTLSIQDIADRTGVYYQTVRRIGEGRSWAPEFGGPVEVRRLPCEWCGQDVEGQRNKRYCCKDHRLKANSHRGWERQKARAA
jgi:hypothetical protein